MGGSEKGTGGETQGDGETGMRGAGGEEGGKERGVRGEVRYCRKRKQERGRKRRGEGEVREERERERGGEYSWHSLILREVELIWRGNISRV